MKTLHVFVKMISILIFAAFVLLCLVLALNVLFFALDSGSISASLDFIVATFLSLGSAFGATVIAKVVRKRIKRGNSGTIVSAVLLVVAILLTVLASHIAGLLIGMKAPTFDPENYMELDSWVEEILEEDYGEPFPESIPENADDVKYYYTGSTGSKFCEYFEIFAEWKADSAYIESEINRVKSLDGYCGEFTLGSYTCVSAGGGTPFHEETDFHNTVFFAYNLDTGTVRYVYLNAPYIETLSDADSYFYSLEW